MIDIEKRLKEVEVELRADHERQLKAEVKRYAKPDAERFSGKARINKIKPENMAEAGDHAEWAEEFARAFTAALPTLDRGMRSWVVGVKICDEDGYTGSQRDKLRLKVSNGMRGPGIDNGKGVIVGGDKRMWVYVALGSERKPEALAAVVVKRMEGQPGKHVIVTGPGGISGKFGASRLNVGLT